MYMALEYSCLTLKFLCMIILREGHINIKVLFSLLAYDLLLETGDEGIAAQSKGMILTLSAFKRYSVYKAFVIKYYLIAILCFTLNADHSRLSLELLLDLAFNILIGNFGIKLLNLKPLILLKGSLGVKCNLRGKYKGLANLKCNYIYLG